MQTLQREPCKTAVQAMHPAQLCHTAGNHPPHYQQACYSCFKGVPKESKHAVGRLNFATVVFELALETLVSHGNRRLQDQTDNAGTARPAPTLLSQYKFQILEFHTDY